MTAVVVTADTVYTGLVPVVLAPATVYRLVGATPACLVGLGVRRPHGVALLGTGPSGGPARIARPAPDNLDADAAPACGTLSVSGTTTCVGDVDPGTTGLVVLVTGLAAVLL